MVHFNQGVNGTLQIRQHGVQGFAPPGRQMPGQAQSGEGAYGDTQEAPTPGDGFVLDDTIQVTKGSRRLWLQGEGVGRCRRGCGRGQGTRAHTAPASSPRVLILCPERSQTCPHAKVPEPSAPSSTPGSCSSGPCPDASELSLPSSEKTAALLSPPQGKPAVWDRPQFHLPGLPKTELPKDMPGSVSAPFYSNQAWPAAQGLGPLRGSYSLPVLLQPPVSQQGEWGNRGAE